MTDALHDLLCWASDQGVVLEGIRPELRPGRGIGVVATRMLEVNEEVLTVPVTALRAIASTPASVVRRLKGATVHAILAVSLCLDRDSAAFAAWQRVLPSPQDMTACMPICWPLELQSLLPPSAAALLRKQQAKFDQDCALVAAVYPGIGRDDFLYAWLLINTRTFYHVTRRTARRPKDDHMALQPVADLFNHSAEPCCNVAFDTDAFTVVTTRRHEPGDELFIRYGAHSNDFLLVEYGFALLPPATNRWDETALDPYVCPLFSARQRRRLEEKGFWAAYKLDADTVCYRTQVALRILCLSDEHWEAVVGGKRDETEDQAVVDDKLARCLRRYEKDIRNTVAKIDRTAVGDQHARETLAARWLQVKHLVIEALSRIERR